MKYGVIFLLILVAGCTSHPVSLPAPVAVLADKADTKEAILEGMSKRGWVVEEEGDNELVARLNVRTHMAKARIDYSGRKIIFSYAGSHNLNCRRARIGEGCRSIHRKYNYWVASLSSDISAELTERR